MRPPTTAEASRIVTRMGFGSTEDDPSSNKCRAQVSPAMPAPTMTTSRMFLVVGSLLGTLGWTDGGWRGRDVEAGSVIFVMSGMG